MKPTPLITETDWYTETGRRIKVARNEANLTQEELAESAGLKRSSITHIERGTQKTPVYTLYLLSNVLGKPFSELLPNTGIGLEIDFAGKKTTVTPKAKNILEQLLSE